MEMDLMSIDITTENRDHVQADATQTDHSVSTKDKLDPNQSLATDHPVAKIFPHFSKLTRNQRYKKLLQANVLTLEDVHYLKRGGIRKFDLADKLIENVIGYFQTPLGVAMNFIINGKPLIIPMATEETSIIAAASKTARWVSEHGSITTRSCRRHCLGQIQIHQVKNFENLEHICRLNQKQWIKDIHHHVIPSMVKRGGGVQDFQFRKIKHSKGDMAVIHVFVHTCDAMGANLINQICEYLKTPIEQATGESVSVCIVSNLADQCLTSARIVMEGLDTELMDKIESASIFAEADPYRATTSNKGVMNGIDAVLMATGNDIRAVEAGIHAYASQKGNYQSVTQWRIKDNKLHGIFEAPMMIGTVGGMTRIHPTAKMAMKIMGIHSVKDLAEICAAVGLVQNLGAVRALTTVGIIEGHMKLHIKNLTQDAGAKGWEFPVIQKHLEDLIKLKKSISLSRAIEALKVLRKHFKNVKDLKKLRKQQWARELLKELREKY